MNRRVEYVLKDYNTLNSDMRRVANSLRDEQKNELTDDSIIKIEDLLEEYAELKKKETEDKRRSDRENIAEIQAEIIRLKSEARKAADKTHQAVLRQTADTLEEQLTHKIYDTSVLSDTRRMNSVGWQ